MKLYRVPLVNMGRGDDSFLGCGFAFPKTATSPGKYFALWLGGKTVIPGHNPMILPDPLGWLNPGAGLALDRFPTDFLFRGI
jgi:hypothetical protein